LLVSEPERPFVTVAVPTYNRADRLERCLETLLALDYPPDAYEIVVADDGSTDHTAAVVEALRSCAEPRVLRYVRRPHRGINAARNTALALSTGDPECFVDDDEEVPASWLSAMVEGFVAHPDVGCAGGPMRLRYDGRPPRMCGAESFGESELDLGDHPIEAVHVWGGNMAVRRAAIERVGPFREDFRLLGGTETEWQDRLRAGGGTVMYFPDAGVWHVRTQAELRMTYLLVRHFQRGRGQALNALRVGDGYSRARTLRALRRAISHALRARCVVGVIDAARCCGRLVGMAEASVRQRLGLR
jgi:glycosyltransferase involved in cell wall biosynthesis